MEALVQPRSAKSTIISLFPGGNSGRLATASAPASSSAWSSTPAPAPSRYSVWSNSTDPAPSSSRSSAPSNATAPPPVHAGNTTVQGMVDASAIGYGAILDIAEQRNAPPNLLMVLESLHEKNDSKRGSAGWSCRRDVDASDAASMKINIAIPESVRADTNWE
ncbi:hypothetical protein PC128_g13341 [Phytophthora cactorum]|nr:hypothetical protein GQ600_2247 [Phytophthora cactorum]KAG3026816.1 hypothetical protein PC120_g5764 [Phytophthora cactorum]KAG3075335.1 hypothetical protein PC121_g8057 [Phytophthora cactorum]KAG3185362.1 hypothetical protein PC128_g13341 [Phytophthora cactorum]KAG4057771.1 hypothetical protein PC123_g7228 [Phytophthora cactorum]